MHKLLIVDDEWVIREGLTKTIPWNEWNINVIGAATNGEEAIGLLKQHTVDILLTDIRMPGLSGLDLIKESKTLYPNMKIILLTGHDEFNYAQTALKLGAEDFLLKPTNVVELNKTMVKIAAELDWEKAEEDNILSLLIQNTIKENSDKHIEKIRSYYKLRPQFGFLKIKKEDLHTPIPDEPKCILIEKTEDSCIYLYFDIQSETEWEQTINKAKHTLETAPYSSVLSASMLTDSLDQLQHIYKQAKAASTVIHEGPNITIYKYLDANHNLDMEKALLHIDKHYTSSITQSELSTMLHMSNSYFSKLFKQHTGMNFVEFITMKRLNMAKELLKTTNLKSFEIAYEVGYTESRYFNQLFKKHVDYTPIEYRNKFGGMGRGD